MPLQADPTVQYLVRNERNGGIQKKDFEINSPFNTYKNPGLPPAPINNPGKDAILAAVFPGKNIISYISWQTEQVRMYLPSRFRNMKKM